MARVCGWSSAGRFAWECGFYTPHIMPFVVTPTHICTPGTHHPAWPRRTSARPTTQTTTTCPTDIASPDQIAPQGNGRKKLSGSPSPTLNSATRRASLSCTHKHPPYRLSVKRRLGQRRRWWRCDDGWGMQGNCEIRKRSYRIFYFRLRKLHSDSERHVKFEYKFNFTAFKITQHDHLRVRRKWARYCAV